MFPKSCWIHPSADPCTVAQRQRPCRARFEKEPDRRRNELPHALRYVSGMTAPPRFRVGLRVADVETARQFYGGLGFAPAAVIPDAQGELEPWGDRVFSALDPFGFEWEIAQPIPGAEPSDGAADAQEAWFGSPRERP